MPSLWPQLRKALSATPEVVEALSSRNVNFMPRLGGTNVTSQRMRQAFERAQAANYAFLYANQPAVRAVVNLIAENTSQLGLKLYRRISDTEREMESDHPAALTMRYPNEVMPADLWLFEFVADFCVYNNAFAIKFRRGGDTQLTLIRWPPHMVSLVGLGIAVDAYRVHLDDGTFRDVPPADMIHWRSYNPNDPRLGLSPLETLRAELTQDSTTQAAITELSANGLQGGYIERDLEAPEWDEQGKQRFIEDWRRARSASPRETPVLDEGMKFVNTVISPKDADLLASREFSLKTVCQQYGVPPGVLSLDSNDLAEERRQFYSDVLAPVSKKLAKQLDHSILQAEYMETDLYYSFNVDEKLRGDTEARFAALTSAAGRPWKTVNEVRAGEDLPAIETGDDLTIPLNVQLEGEMSPALPAPNVMPMQDPNKPPQDGSYREEPQNRALNGDGKAITPLLPRRAGLVGRRNATAEQLAGFFRAFFIRQERTMKRRMDFQAKAVMDDRWNRELADDTFREARDVVAREGTLAARRIAGKFDVPRTESYLEAKTIGMAEGVNRLTAERIARDGSVAAFTEAKDVRAAELGLTLATSLFAWSAKEALHQAPDRRNRLVTISGGDCEICAPYQGTWRPDDLDGWPPFHNNCNCTADLG